MADTHGGYRKPANPAPVSGPGKLSRRTDGGPGQKLMVAPGGAYGDREALLAQEHNGAMSQADSIPTPNIPAGQPQQGAAPSGPPPGVPFGAPTQRPNEPVTSGVDIGPGAGSAALPTPPNAGQQPGNGYMANMLRQLSATGMTGNLATLYQAALTRGV